MAEKGWIKLHRKTLDCWIWQEKPFDKGRAWVDLLLLAQHHDKKLLIDNEIVLISRGSFMTSMVKLAERWGWSRNKTMRFIKLLENEEMLNTERTPKGTLVTIVKYEDYQVSDTGDETTRETPLGTPLGTSDETQNKNVKNIKNNICSFSTSESDDLGLVKEQDSKDKKKAEKEELEKNFNIIYNNYPKKVGRARGFDLYKGWLKGRDIGGTKVKLTNKQMWLAIEGYKRQCEENGTDKQYIKQFDTFMNKPILDYLPEEE